MKDYSNLFPFPMNGDPEFSGGGVSDAPTDESSDDGATEEVQAAPTAAQKKMIKQLKLKFNGKEITEDLPFEIDEANQDWYVKQRQKAMLADHKGQEYSQLEREVGAFIQELRKNPKKALSNPAIGLDIKEFAASILQEEIERSQKSPEQLEKEALQAELQAMKEEREKEKEDFTAKELERLTEREYERYDTLMANAIQSSGLPQTPYVVKKMTEYMILGVENGLDITPDQIIPIIRQEYKEDIQDSLRGRSVKEIEEFLGKDILDVLRKGRVAAVKPPVPVRSAIKDVAAKKPEPKVEAKRQTIKDFLGV